MVCAFRRHWVFAVSVFILFGSIGIVFGASLSGTEGRLIYPLDDTYIHMAVAKNIAIHGVWGPTQYEFGSASSSPLWSLLLALTYLVFGINEIAPLALNVLFAVATLGVLYLAFHYYQVPPWLNLVGLVLLMFFGPLLSTVACGMEHSAQILLTLLFGWLAARYIQNPVEGRRLFPWLLLVTALMVAMRYEGLFLTVFACGWLLLRRRLIDAGMLGLSALFPLVLFAIYSLGNGGLLLPNSVLVKGLGPSLAALGLGGFLQVHILILYLQFRLITPGIAAGVIIAADHLSRRNQRQAPSRSALPGADDLTCATRKDELVVMALIFAPATFVHAVFARSVWLHRYDVYLLTLGLLVLVPLMQRTFFSSKRSVEKLAGLVLAIALIGVFSQRAIDTIVRVPRAMVNIYEQHFQMARFLRAHYNQASVAAGDIGAITYFTDIRLLDMVGLASQDVASSILNRQFTVEVAHELARHHGVQIAVIYDTVQSLPSAIWTKVGTWTIEGNVVCWGETVSFYAATPEETDNLIANLRAFSSVLPPTVIQGGLYLEGEVAAR